MHAVDIIHSAYYQIRFSAVEIERRDELIGLIGTARSNDTADMVCLSAFADRTADQAVSSRYDDG